MAILLLQVQTAAFLFTLCLILTLFRAGKGLRERKKNTFNYIIGHTLTKKHCPSFLTWATGMSSSKRVLQISRCQKDLFWNKSCWKAEQVVYWTQHYLTQTEYKLRKVTWKRGFFYLIEILIRYLSLQTDLLCIIWPKRSKNLMSRKQQNMYVTGWRLRTSPGNLCKCTQNLCISQNQSKS